MRLCPRNRRALDKPCLKRGSSKASGFPSAPSARHVGLPGAGRERTDSPTSRLPGRAGHVSTIFSPCAIRRSQHSAAFSQTVTPEAESRKISKHLCSNHAAVEYVEDTSQEPGRRRLKRAALAGGSMTGVWPRTSRRWFQPALPASPFPLAQARPRGNHQQAHRWPAPRHVIPGMRDTRVTRSATPPTGDTPRMASPTE